MSYLNPTAEEDEWARTHPDFTDKQLKKYQGNFTLEYAAKHYDKQARMTENVAKQHRDTTSKWEELQGQAMVFREIARQLRMKHRETKKTS